MLYNGESYDLRLQNNYNLVLLLYLINLKFVSLNKTFIVTLTVFLPICAVPEENVTKRNIFHIFNGYMQNHKISGQLFVDP